MGTFFFSDSIFVKTSIAGLLFGSTLLMVSCGEQRESKLAEQVDSSVKFSHIKSTTIPKQVKPVIYQVFTRLFGNTNTTNKPWGTIEQNGVGKFNDFTDKALQGIKELGVSHIWFTGVPHHALVTDYTEYGISLDDPDVVKGRAGSPYAVKDYYNVNPDLAENPANRLQEFEALIKRTHDNGMKVIIDIVPNHVARSYSSLSLPKGEENFGESDNTSIEYARNNNFYYIVDEAFKVPTDHHYVALGGESHPLIDQYFHEFPAKWTGNGSRKAKPNIHDWYETVKVNYGVKPDGSYDFPRLPEELKNKDFIAHAAFWKNKSLPDSWHKFHSIVHYWLDKGVDGFRYDMAELVPVEFWSYLNSSIKMKNSETLLLAEVYQPALYRDYIHLGKMDYLYDKVDFYDSLKLVMQGTGDAQALENIQERFFDIEPYLLHFLENHDEQRIASPDFSGDANKGKPALVVSALIGRSPTLLYFGQEVGEKGEENLGFGRATRTTIFDYVGVPAHQRWMNNGKFDGAKLSESELSLRNFYKDIMKISAFHPAMSGEYQSLHSANIQANSGYSQQQFSFARWSEKEKIIVLNNFSNQQVTFNFHIPSDLIDTWKLKGDVVILKDLLSHNEIEMKIIQGTGVISMTLSALGSVVYEVE